MHRWVKMCLVCCFVTSPAVYGGASLVTSVGALGPNDSVNWSQLGGDQTVIPQDFAATSVGLLPVAGHLGKGTGLVSVVCPAAPSCSWAAQPSGFASGESLIWTNFNGPLSLSFAALTGAGAYIQEDTPGTFTANIQAFDATNTSVGSFAVTSDAAGDPLFIGVTDTIPEISKVMFSLSACGGFGCDVNDFAVGTLYLKTPVSAATPEPSALISSLLLVGLLWLFRIMQSRRRSAHS